MICTVLGWTQLGWQEAEEMTDMSIKKLGLGTRNSDGDTPAVWNLSA